MIIMERMVNGLSNRLESLLSAENSAREAVEEAERNARGIRTSIPGEISAIEDEYESELAQYEKKGLEKINMDLQEIRKSLEETLSHRKEKLESASSVLGPRAQQLIRSAVEGERG